MSRETRKTKAPQTAVNIASHRAGLGLGLGLRLGLGIGLGLGLGLGLARLPQVSHTVVGRGHLVRVEVVVGFGLGLYLPYISPIIRLHLA